MDSDAEMHEHKHLVCQVAAEQIDRLQNKIWTKCFHVSLRLHMKHKVTNCGSAFSCQSSLEPSKSCLVEVCISCQYYMHYTIGSI